MTSFPRIYPRLKWKVKEQKSTMVLYFSSSSLFSLPPFFRIFFFFLCVAFFSFRLPKGRNLVVTFPADSRFSCHSRVRRQFILFLRICSFPHISFTSSWPLSVFLVKKNNAFVPVKRVYSVNTYLWISLSHKGVSKPENRASELSENSEAERCVASERS